MKKKKTIKAWLVLGWHGKPRDVYFKEIEARPLCCCKYCKEEKVVPITITYEV